MCLFVCVLLLLLHGFSERMHDETLWQLECHSTSGCPRLMEGCTVVRCCSRQLCFCQPLPFHLPVPEPAHPFAHPLVDWQLVALLYPSCNTVAVKHTLLLLAFASPTLIIPPVPYGESVNWILFFSISCPSVGYETGVETRARVLSIYIGFGTSHSLDVSSLFKSSLAPLVLFRLPAG